VFLLPSILLGIAFALLLGGKPSRILNIDFRYGWTVFLALGLQIVLFSGARDLIPEPLLEPLHLGTYVLLFWFAFANFKNLLLLPLFLGMALNAIAILSNGGRMPVNQEAWEATGLDGAAHSNVAVGADRLAFLGDIFALPSELPLANVFSIGDILLGIGTVMLIVTVSTTETSRPALSSRRLLDPLRTPSFRRLASGKLLSQLGDWLTVAALVGWIYETTGSVSQVAALLVIRLAPPVLGSGLAAAVVDRFPRQRLLILVEVGRGLLVAAALAGILMDLRLVAFAAIAASGLLSAVSSATIRALVPSILERQQYPAGNAVLGFAQDGAMALGTLAAGIALTTTTASVALLFDLVTFVFAALLYSGVRARPLAAVVRGPEGGFREGLRYILHRRLLIVVIGAFATATLATGLTNASLPKFLGTELGLGPGAYGFGVAALAGGLALGSAVTGLAPVGEIGGRWIGVALLMMASLFGVLALTDHAPTALLLLGMIGFLDGTTDVLFDTIVQREVDPAYYGRVFGLGSALFTTTMMGAVAFAPLANGLGAPHSVILVAAFGLLVASIVALAGTRRPSASIPPSPGRIALDTRP
jgi:hypothetical protein